MLPADIEHACRIELLINNYYDDIGRGGPLNNEYFKDRLIPSAINDVVEGSTNFLFQIFHRQSHILLAVNTAI